MARLPYNTRESLEGEALKTWDEIAGGRDRLTNVTNLLMYDPPMALASVAAGADGLLIEVHPNPDKALSDGPQQLKPSKFVELMKALRPVAEAVGRSI